jgi:hypothetical protein
MAPRKEVEVEARERHNGVVYPLLVADHKVGSAIPYELEAVVVCALDGLEVGGGGGKEGDILEVGVVFLELAG